MKLQYTTAGRPTAAAPPSGAAPAPKASLPRLDADRCDLSAAAAAALIITLRRQGLPPQLAQHVSRYTDRHGDLIWLLQLQSRLPDSPDAGRIRRDIYHIQPYGPDPNLLRLRHQTEVSPAPEPFRPATAYALLRGPRTRVAAAILRRHFPPTASPGSELEQPPAE